MNALRASSLWAASVALLVTSQAPLLAQMSAAEVRAEITFARGLAADWSFVDLAEEVIQAVEDEGVTGKMSEQLGLVKCDVFSIGARNEREPDKRNELFERALTAYSQFIERNPFSDSRASAEAALVDTSAVYARALSSALEEAVGDDVDKLKERQVEVLQAAVERTGDLISALQSSEQRSEKETRELYDLMLNRGQMLADIAQAQEDGSYFFSQAIGTLESLVFEAGEGTPYALRAYVGIGRVYTYMEQYDEAAAYFEAVIEQTIPTDPERWREMQKQGMTEGEKNLRFAFLEIAISGLMEAYSNTGDLATACNYGLHYYNTQRVEGINFTPQGYVSLLGVARALLDSGGYVGGNLAAGEARWYETEEAMKDAVSAKRNQSDALNMALRIAQNVNDENKGNVLQVKAQKLISEIITRPGATASPEILFEAAQGEYYEKSYLVALDGFRRVLDSIEGKDQATRIEYGAKVMNHIANCYRRLDRPLEASLAFREGCTTWLGDIEYDSKNAQGYYKMISDVADAAILEKEEIAKLVSEAETIVAEKGTASGDEVNFNLGKKAARKPTKDYKKAIEFYEKVAKGSNFWEKAQVEIGICLFRMGKANDALAAFDSYLEDFLNDPQASASTSPQVLARRKEASAAAEFYRGMIVFTRADKSADEEGLRKVVEYLKDYYRRYPEQERLSPWTMQMVMNSHLGLKDRESARDVISKMVEFYPEDDRTGKASVQFYKVLQDTRGNGNDAEVLREMAELLELGNSTSTAASFVNLRKESQHWVELEEWAKAEGVLKRLVAKFGEDPENAESVRRYVMPDLGKSLLQQHNLVDAKAVLAPLIEDSASRDTIIDWVHSVSGWVEGSGSDLQRVLGAGEEEAEFELAASKMAAIAAGGEKWTSCEWYYQKFMVVYTYYAWSEVDSRKLESARKQLADIEDQAPNFDAVEEWCSHADTEESVQQALGKNVLRQRFQWLKSKL